MGVYNRTIGNNLYKYDEHCRCIYCKTPYCETWWEYNPDNSTTTHYKNCRGDEYVSKCDKNNNLIYLKCDGFEHWYTYDENGNCIHHKRSDGFEEQYKYNCNGGRTRYTNSN